MNRLLSLVAAAAIAAVIIPSAASAQQDTTKRTDSTTIKQNVSTGDVAVANRLDALLAAVNDSASAATIQGLTTLTAEQVTVVDVAEIATDSTAAAPLHTALETRKAERSALQAAIAGNAAITAALAAKNVDPATVVAAHVAEDGTVTVYHYAHAKH